MDSYPLVKWLLDHGVSPNLQPMAWFNHSVLFTAARYASLDVVKLLVAYGADVTKGDVALGAVIGPRGDRLLVLQFLLEQRAPANQLDHSGTPEYIRYLSKKRRSAPGPLHVAVAQGKYVFAKILEDHGASWDVKDSKGRTPRGIERLVDLVRSPYRGCDRWE